MTDAEKITLLTAALEATLAHAETMLCELEKTDDLSEYPYIVRARAVLAAVS